MYLRQQFGAYAAVPRQRSRRRSTYWGTLRSVPQSVAGIPVGNPYGGLGALDPAAATEQIFPQASVRSGAGHNQSIRDQILASAQAGQLINISGAPAYLPGSSQCAGVTLLKPALVSTAGSLALKFAGATGPAAPFVLLAGGILEVFGAIFGHHAAAVKKERSILCAAVPAANQSIALIDQAVQQGQATPSDAIAALDNVVTGFKQAVASIIHGADPMASGECNAACVMLSELRAVVLVKQSQYQDMLAVQQSGGGGGGITSAVASVAAAAKSSGLPSWLLWAAGGYLLWDLL